MKNLKTSFILLFLLSLVSFISNAQVEKGDKNVSAQFSFNSPVGVESAAGNWNLFVNAGQYYTDNIEIGVTLLLTGTTGDNSSTTPGYGAFANYSFLTGNAKMLPYAGVQFFSLKAGDADPFISIGVNAGLKIFATEKVFINNRLDYGTLISPSEAEGGNLNLTVGLGFLF